MFITIIVFIVILSLLVFVHELGHFVTARKAGVKVFEFGLGLPPRVVGLRRKADNPKKWEWIYGGKEVAEETVHTIYSLNLLPIGGFVKPKGEDEYIKDQDSLTTKPAGIRALVMSAGVIMNFLTAMVILAVAFALGFPSVITDETDLSRVKDRQVQVASVVAESPAAVAGIEPGDIILSLSGLTPTTVTEIQETVANTDQALSIEIQRGAEIINSEVTPQYYEETQGPALGVGLLEIGTVRYPIHEAIWKGVSGTVLITGRVLQVFGDIITGGFTAQELEEQIAGPVGIARMTGDFIDLGFVFVLQFAALLSINLAIINIMPFPALDGGRIVFIIIEKIRGKPVSQKVENIFHTVGFALLILLILVVTFNDISRIFG